jgi:enterochelin esterase family protein
VTLADASNPLAKPVLPGGSHSLVHVPGPLSLPWEVNDVPRGVVHHHFYRSSSVGDERDYYVYTPPGYRTDAATSYPVLYLLHGITDDASAWLKAGRANVILDNLIARGQVRAMVVVNTLGYGLPATAGFAGMIDPKGQDNFRKALLEEVVPRVESAYRVATDSANRAIAGLSMGGSQAFASGLNHPERFGWIASFSGAFSMFTRSTAPGPTPPLDDRVLEATFPTLDAAAVNRGVRLLWFRVGTGDFLLESNRRMRDWLASRGVRFSYAETDGAHTWMVWRRYLIDLLPLLFTGM